MRYSKEKDPEEYYREALMLFTSWRDEDKLIGDKDTYEDMYQDHREAVDHKRLQYEQSAAELDLAAAQMEDQDPDELQNDIAPGMLIFLKYIHVSIYTDIIFC